MGMAAVMTNL